MLYICLGNGCSILENDSLLWGFLAGKSWAFLSPEIAHPTPVVRRFPIITTAPFFKRDFQQAMKLISRGHTSWHWQSQEVGQMSKPHVFLRLMCQMCGEKGWLMMMMMMMMMMIDDGYMAKVYGSNCQIVRVPGAHRIILALWNSGMSMA